jgi:hypothetical protein
MIEFTCEDCETLVVDIMGDAPPAPPLCNTCQFARTLPEEDRPRFREIMRAPAAAALRAAGLKDTPELREQYRKGNFEQ